MERNSATSLQKNGSQMQHLLIAMMEGQKGENEATES